MLADAPRLSPNDAERLAREHFGIDGRATELTSERDQNFFIAAAGRRIVLKIANASEDRAMLDAQQRALAHLASHIATTPRVVAAVDGSSLVAIALPNGKRHFIWAITWLDGRPLATAIRRSAELWHDFGREIGRLDAALADFDDPAIHRDFYWDLANGRPIVESNRHLLTDEPLRSALDRLISQFDERTAP